MDAPRLAASPLMDLAPLTAALFFCFFVASFDLCAVRVLCDILSGGIVSANHVSERVPRNRD